MDRIIFKKIEGYSLFLILFGGLVLLLIGYGFGRLKEYRVQNTGEALVSNHLKLFVEGKDGILVDNVTLPCSSGTTQIDHVFITSKGVFVIETKHYTGWIFADEKSKKWMQTIYKKRYFFQNPIHQNYKHFKVIEELFDFIPKKYIHPIVIFTGDAEFKKGQPNGVIQINSLSSYLLSFQQDVICINDLQMALGRLQYVRFPDSEETDRKHLQNLYDSH